MLLMGLRRNGAHCCGCGCCCCRSTCFWLQESAEFSGSLNTLPAAVQYEVGARLLNHHNQECVLSNVVVSNACVVLEDLSAQSHVTSLPVQVPLRLALYRIHCTLLVKAQTEHFDGQPTLPW